MDGKLYRDTPLGQWFAGKGGVVHDALVFRKESTGHRLEATDAIKAGNELVSMPYELSVTVPGIKETLGADLTSGLRDHQVICLYLMLHDCALAGLPTGSLDLRHLEYIKTFPRPEQMQTALWFTGAEFDLLRGSNLHPAVLDRKQQWQWWYEALQDKVKDQLPFDASQFSWERFVWASTALSSRAFPSYLLDGDKSDPTQILMPCIDVFNHKRATAVTWFSDHKQKRMQLITDEDVVSGNEVFNNYGAKPNDELLLGYGFVLKDNDSDIVSLRFGSAGEDATIKLLEQLKIPISKSHYIRKDVDYLPNELKAQVRVLVAEEEDLEAIRSSIQATSEEPWQEAAGFLNWPNELDMLDQLGGMFDAKAQGVRHALERTKAARKQVVGKKRRRSEDAKKLQSETSVSSANALLPWGADDIREEIRSMIEIYLEGQLQILERCKWLQERDFRKTVERARADGFDIEDDEDEEEDEDSDEDEEEGGDSEMPSAAASPDGENGHPHQ